MPTAGIRLRTQIYSQPYDALLTARRAVMAATLEREGTDQNDAYAMRLRLLSKTAVPFASPK